MDNILLLKEKYLLGEVELRKLGNSLKDTLLEGDFESLNKSVELYADLSEKQLNLLKLIIRESGIDVDEYLNK